MRKVFFLVVGFLFAVRFSQAQVSNFEVPGMNIQQFRDAGKWVRGTTSRAGTQEQELSADKTWNVLNGPSLPVSLERSGVIYFESANDFNRERPLGTGVFRPIGSFKISGSIKVEAIEVRIILFDLWGNAFRIISRTWEKPKARGQDFEQFKGWQGNSEEFDKYRSSVVYVNKVKFEDGTISSSELESVEGALAFLKLSTPREWLEISRGDFDLGDK
jgi:hypothetical protein